MIEFTKALESQEWPEITALKGDVEEYLGAFPLSHLEAPEYQA